MFILTEKKSGGVHAIKDKTNTKTVQVFEERDDAERSVSYTHLTLPTICSV